MGSYLQLDRVDKIYEQTLALRNVSLTIGPGESILLEGENGAGKSTLMQIAANQMAPSAGKVSLFEQKAVLHSNTLKQKLGVVANHSYAIATFTVAENIEFYRKLRQVFCPTSIDNSFSQLLLDKLGLKAQWNTRFDNLSTGFKRRFDLALALAHRPLLLLLDEPFLGLDDSTTSSVIKILTEFRENGASLLLVAHGELGKRLKFDRRVRLKEGFLC